MGTKSNKVAVQFRLAVGCPANQAHIVSRTVATESCRNDNAEAQPFWWAIPPINFLNLPHTNPAIWKVNLKIMANGFRDQKSDEVAYEIAALFCHFTPDFQRMLTPEKWAECLQRFFRGQFDAELAEKVSHKDANLRVECFRVLELFGAKLQQRSESSFAKASQEEAASLLEKERSDFHWVTRKLSSEVVAWNAYKEQVQKWQCTSALEKMQR